MKKFNLNEFDPNKSYVIEASAGTGKTYNIVEIVDKLVNNYNVKLNEILIVTYTDKAAGELKSRIREKIRGEDVDNAPIYTIHSFCQSAIKEFGISANLPFHLDVIDESEISRFADRYLREGEVLETISYLLDCSCELNFDSLKETFVKGVQKYYLNYEYEEDETIVSLEKEIDFKSQLEWITDVLKAESFEELFDKYQDIGYYFNILKDSDNIKLNEMAFEISKNFKQNFKFNGNKFRRPKEGKATDEEIEAYDFFSDLKQIKVNINEIMGNLYIKDFYYKWQNEKEINKSQTFDDMIRYVREAILNDEKLKNKLKQKYSRAIIDEFQDTNQRQFDIFSNVFLEDDNHKIIVVGDPKQSIYSFQGADINVYYNAVNAIINKGGEMCMLNKNYRSTSNMVNSCNKLFNYYDFKGTTFVDSDSLSIKNGDDKEHKVLFNNEEMNAIWIATSHDRMSINEKNTRLFSKIAVQQIIDCCTKDDNGNTKLQVKDKGNKTYRNVSFKDFAVLARTSNEMKYIEKALKNAGIPYVRYKDTKLFLGRECIHWISLLEAINSIDFTGRNRNIFKKVLFTSFFGYSIEEIKSDSFNRDDNFANDKINKWKELAYIHNWEDMFDDIIVNSNLVEKLKSLKEIQTLSIYKQIANYCIDYLSSGRSMDELIRTLKNLSKGGTDESDDPTGSLVEKSTNFDCVQIMTIHASKGLQFPVVIGVCGFSAPFNGGEVFTYHKMDENTKKEKQILTFRKNELVSLENEAEWKRLFYVAYTRAQFLLILPFYSKYGRDFLEKSIKGLMSEHADSIRFIEDNHLTYSELRNCSSKILSSKDVEVESNEEKLEQDEILKQLIKNSYTKKSYKHSYSSLSHDLNEHEEYDYENKEGVMIEDLSLFDLDSKNVIMEYDSSSNYVSLPADYPKGARLGTALHEILENTDFTNYKDNIENIIRRCFMNQGVIAKDSWVDATIDLIKNVVNIKLPIIQGSESNGEYIKLNQISSVNRKDEMEFNFNILNQKLKNYCNGYVDLVFKNGDYYSIIDWKSDTLNEDFESYKDNNSLKSHVDKCYSIQRVLYSYCLIKWLKMYNPNLTEQEIFEKHFGGIYYVFLRGCSFDTYNGVYAQTWSSWKNIEDSFNKIIKEKVGG